MNRLQILETAATLTGGDRNKTYGEPKANLTLYAELCQAYLGGRDVTKLTPTDGAILMTLAKISRIAVNPRHMDNYVDGAAYMAIAGECSQ
jgi:hypothetical protein